MENRVCWSLYACTFNQRAGIETAAGSSSAPPAFSSAATRSRLHRPRKRSISSAVQPAPEPAPPPAQQSTARRAMPRAVSWTAVRSKPCRLPAQPPISEKEAIVRLWV
jgi:hypothetical protein